MSACAFDVSVSYIVFIQEAVELPVIFEQEILRTAGYKHLRNLFALILQSFNKHLGVVVTLQHLVEVSEAFAVIFIICKSVLSSGLHSRNAVNDERRGKSGGLSENVRVPERRVQCSEAAHGKPHNAGLIGGHSKPECLADIVHKLLAEEGAVIVTGGNAVQPESIFARGHNYRKIIFFRNIFGYPVSRVPRIAVEQKKSFYLSLFFFMGNVLPNIIGNKHFKGSAPPEGICEKSYRKICHCSDPPFL